MQVINAILPVLLISVLGYILARTQFISKEGNVTLSKLTFTILIPCLLFLGITKAKLDNIFYYDFIASYFIPVTIVFVVGSFVAGFIFKLNKAEQSVFALGGAYSNATVIGIPICLYTLGEDSLVPLSIIVTFHNFVLFTLGTISAERGRLTFSTLLSQLKRIFMGFITNPITMSLVLGVIVNVIGLKIPTILYESIEFIGKAAVPISFLVLGSSLSGYSIRGQLTPVFSIVTLKLILMPLLVWYSTFHIFSIEPLWAKTAVVIASAPVGIATHVFAQRYKSCEGYLASSILLSTVLSVLTFSLVMEMI